MRHSKTLRRGRVVWFLQGLWCWTNHMGKLSSRRTPFYRLGHPRIIGLSIGTMSEAVRCLSQLLNSARWSWLTSQSSTASHQLNFRQWREPEDRNLEQAKEMHHRLCIQATFKFLNKPILVSAFPEPNPVHQLGYATVGCTQLVNRVRIASHGIHGASLPKRQWHVPALRPPTQLYALHCD